MIYRTLTYENYVHVTRVLAPRIRKNCPMQGNETFVILHKHNIKLKPLSLYDQNLSKNNYLRIYKLKTCRYMEPNHFLF